MQAYQEEYIANLKEIAGLALQGRQNARSFGAYLECQLQCKEQEE